MAGEITFSSDGLGRLIERLTEDKYQVIGPKLRDGALVYDPIQSVSDLPRGWTEEQEKGKYRLKRRGDGAYFGYTVGPTSWKRFLFPPREKLWGASRKGKGFQIESESREAPALAFLGVRACDLHAIAIQDKVFLEGQFKDERYGGRRESALIIAVQCTVSAPTCFCTSMKTGPEINAQTAADIVLTEIVEGQNSRFLAEGYSERGRTLLEGLGTPATGVDRRSADGAVAKCREQVETTGRRLDSQKARQSLASSPEHPRWDEVAEKCINCANCTLACPTCFCSTVEDVTDLTGDHAERWRRWDSCFTIDFSHLHGGSVRTSARSRYRQWMTHKLSTWWEQFNSSGCVGCGRCIVWCPVGIDITEEAAAVGDPK